MRSDHLRSFGDPETGHAGADDERGNFSPSVWSGSRAGKDCVEISDAGARNKTLSTIDNVGIALALGHGFQSGHVRAGVRFRQSEAAIAFPAAARSSQKSRTCSVAARLIA